MDQIDFDIVVNQTIESTKRLLLTKGGEYAGSEDRLANFKRGAVLAGTTPLVVALIYAAKHWDAVSTFVRKNAAGFDQYLSEPIDGRLDDLINYCTLIKALIKEQEQANAVKEMVSFRDMPVDTSRLSRSLADADSCLPSSFHPHGPR